MMARYFLSIFISLLPIHSFAQNTDFGGDWIGILRQNDGGLAEIYEFSITITQDKNGNLSGTSKIHVNDARDYGIMSLTGKANAKGVSIQEHAVLAQTIRTSFYWCIKNYTLKYDPTTESLSGSWSAGGGCPPGTIELVRPKKITSVNKKPKEKVKPKEEKPAITAEKVVSKEPEKPLYSCDRFAAKLFEHGRNQG